MTDRTKVPTEEFGFWQDKPTDGTCRRCGYCPVNSDGLCATCVDELAGVLDAVTDKILSYRPVDKGLAAKKTKRKLARKAKADD